MVRTRRVGLPRPPPGGFVRRSHAPAQRAPVDAADPVLARDVRRSRPEPLLAVPTGSKVKTIKDLFALSRISIIEIDGSNKAEIYYGSVEPNVVVPWPDNSRLVVISSFPTQTASQPNLYGINLK